MDNPDQNDTQHGVNDNPQAMPEENSATDKTESFKLQDENDTPQTGAPDNLEFILDIPLEITVELGRVKMLINELLKLGQGSVIELSKPAGETLEVLANQKVIAKGEVVVVNDKYGIRLTEIASPVERIEKLK